jgi:hypothetical protein
MWNFRPLFSRVALRASWWDGILKRIVCLLPVVLWEVGQMAVPGYRRRRKSDLREERYDVVEGR